MRYWFLILLVLSGCGHTKLIINHPTAMAHIKGKIDNVDGAAITVRVRWDLVSK